jgi:anaerobic ribonucleoside-triphosphate reductase activating protein
VALTAPGGTAPGGTAPGGTPWRIHAVLPRSRANGPGVRFVIWSQGCALACPGCFNPETHPSEPPHGEPRTAEALASMVLAQRHSIEGVTLTGGEPLEQPAAVAAFCERIKAGSDLGIVVLTGFTRREIAADPGREHAVRNADMVIAGRYNAGRHLGRGLRGSANKTYWARTARYSPADFETVPDVELILAPDGSMTITGLPEGTPA